MPRIRRQKMIDDNISKRILLVDDDEFLLDAFKMLLEYELDAQVFEARSMKDIVALGNKALECDVAILDVNLGPNEPSGVDVHNYLLTEGFSGSICFLTGHATSHPQVQETLRIGNVTVFSKPTDPDTILRFITGGASGPTSS